jgi:two-component system, chemotaxis family, CheB/CheR fusion protein
MMDTDAAPTHYADEAPAQPEQKPHYIAGIGASAGGLEALTLLVGALPAGLNCTFAIVQHLSPHYRSMMVELIGRETAMRVKAVEDGEVPLPGVIYIGPPKWNLLLRNGVFALVEPRPDVAPKPSANLFLKSLADEKGEYAIGVVLSGTGSDGAVGIRAIKANGGMTFAQSPDTAKYASMPQAAINTVAVDYILPPHTIAHEIAQFVQRAPAAPATPPDVTDTQRFGRLLLEVRRFTKIDFSGYKETTLWRRVRRRMATNRVDTLEEYLDLAVARPEELESLAKDILISVTSFFRDAEAFGRLEAHLKSILEEKPQGSELRVWVPGCATGEEAYTIAIILAELLGEGLRHLNIQIFATDIDVDALNMARRATFPSAALGELSAELVARYFMPVGDQYEIVKQVRDLVVFARQDLVLDPPFLRLDLISCRNLLIYFSSELQAKVLSVMNYALADHGLLFLGRSENISQQETLFEPVDPKARLFRPRGRGARTHVARALNTRLAAISGRQLTEPRVTINAIFNQLAFAAYLPPSVLLDTRLYVIHTFGDLKTYIQLPEGTPQLEFPNMLGKELRMELLTLVHYSRTKRKLAKGRQRRVAPGRAGLVRLAVYPHRPHEPEEMFLVSFEPGEATRRPGTRGNASTSSERVLEDELIATREHLQTVIEELETSNEEMQALNEEVQAANEELQASNEELEASNEELQASNEELVTVNEEMLVKSAELSSLNSDFESVQNAVEFPLLVLDPQLQVTRFNVAAQRVLGLSPASRGRPFANLKLPPVFAGLPAATEQVLHDGEPLNRPLTDGATDYLLHIVTYSDHLGALRGVVVGLADQTETARAERQARELQGRLLEVMDNATSLFAVKDAAGRYEFANNRFLSFFGLTLEQVRGRTDYQLFDAELADRLREGDFEVMRRRCPVDRDETLVRGERLYYLRVTRFPLKDPDGNVTAVCTQAADISEQRAAQEGLRLAANVFHSAGEGICVTDAEGILISVNESFSRITGYAAEEVLGSTCAILKSGRHSPEFYAAMWADLRGCGIWQGEIWNHRKDGQLIPEWLTISAVRDDQGKVCNYVGIFSDISAIKASHERIEHLATHDELTGLPNRNLFNDRVKHAIARAAHRGEQLHVVFVDLDNFKVINDNLGHAAGDELLREAAQRIGSCVRDEDTVARLGGDEFILMLEDADTDLVAAMGKRILDFLSASYRVQGRDVFVTASLGVSSFPDDAQDSETLLKNADTAMYKAKERGKNQLQFFSVEMKLHGEQRMAIETGIRLALQEDQFTLLFQPEVDLASGRIVSVEALIRWTDGPLGEVPPAQFIAVAEQSGLIIKVTDWVVRRAFATLRRWVDAGLTAVPVFVNISPLHFRSSDLAACLGTQAEIHGVSPGLIGIEITEGAIMEGSESTTAILHSLRNQGVKVYVDDFGTGYSSLTYLKRYPIDGLKIDRSFVDGIADDPDDQAIATAVIGVARALGVAVVAEGVETEAQRVELMARGCTLAQGFLFHQPMTESALALLLERRG